MPVEMVLKIKAKARMWGRRMQFLLLPEWQHEEGEERERERASKRESEQE
jgi:hypothetical protein